MQIEIVGRYLQYSKI